MKTININGIEYVQKKELDKLKNQKTFTKKDLETMKQSILETIDEFDTTKKTYKGRRDGTQVFKPSPSILPITINGITEDGRFMLKRGRTSKYTLKQVKFLKKQISKKTTYGDIRKFSTVLGLRNDMVRKLIYNINEGVFDDYI